MVQEPLTIHTSPRTALGRRARWLRRQGQIPAVVYGRGVPSRPITVAAADLHRIRRLAGESSLLHLLTEGGPSVPAIIQEVACDPVTSQPIHVDFHAVSLTEEIHTRIPLTFTGAAPAVHGGVGVLVKQIDHLDVRALPNALVHEIAVDLTSLAAVGDVIRIRDVAVPVGITVQQDPDDIVISVSEVTAEAESEPAVTPAQVEVVGKGKEVTGGSVGAGGPAPAAGKERETKKR